MLFNRGTATNSRRGTKRATGFPAVDSGQQNQEMPSLQAARRWYPVVRAITRSTLPPFVEIDIHGLAHIPADRGAVLVSNHRSDQDPAVLACATPRYMAWIAAEYMSRVSVTGWLMRRLGVMFAPKLRHGDGLLGEARSVIKAGGMVAVFPEGEDYIFNGIFDDPMAPFHRDFAVLARQTGAPIVPAVINGLEERLVPIRIPRSVKQELASTHDFSVGRMIPRYRRVAVRYGPTIDSRDLDDDELIARTRRAMERLHAEEPAWFGLT